MTGLISAPLKAGYQDAVALGTHLGAALYDPDLKGWAAFREGTLGALSGLKSFANFASVVAPELIAGEGTVSRMAFFEGMPQISSFGPRVNSYLWAGGIGGTTGAVLNPVAAWAKGETPTWRDSASGFLGGVTAGVGTLASADLIEWGFGKVSSLESVKTFSSWTSPGFGAMEGQLVSDRMDATLQPERFSWDSNKEWGRAFGAFGLGVAAGRLLPDGGGLSEEGLRLNDGQWFGSQTASPVLTVAAPVAFKWLPEPSNWSQSTEGHPHE